MNDRQPRRESTRPCSHLTEVQWGAPALARSVLHAKGTIRAFASRVWPRLSRFLDDATPPSRSPLVGYATAAGGVILATFIIGLILRAPAPRIGNVSMLYLLPVLFLGALYGSGPAVFASVLSFLAFDFFFVPPLHRLDVSSPSEWLSLGLLLATALVTGQLTGALRSRAHEARLRQHQTQTLYELARTIASVTDLDALLPAIAERVVTMFAPSGMVACSILLPDGAGHLAERALVPDGGTAARALSIRGRGRQYLARDAFVRGETLGVGPAAAASTHFTASQADVSPSAVCYVPLRGSATVVGVLGVAGASEVRDLVIANPADGIGERPAHLIGIAGPSAQAVSLRRLFEAVCGQIALAVERDSLRRTAVHAEALRESDRLKDALLGSVTHDLRTPLAAIKAITSGLAQRDIAWTEVEWRDQVANIDHSVDRLSRLVSNLLDLSRLEAGVAAPRPDWHLLGEVIATVLDRLELAGQLSGRLVRLDLPPDLPLIPMDHEQIEQVLTNVIENALKYSPSAASVSMTARVLTPEPRREPAVEVRVTDAGIGIPAEELEAIFGKFYRVRQATIPWDPARPPTGTGLGLAICRAIVDAHGGRIWAESLPGQGTTIAFTLPIPTAGPHGGLPELADPTLEGGQNPDAISATDRAPANGARAREGKEADLGS